MDMKMMKKEKEMKRLSVGPWRRLEMEKEKKEMMEKMAWQEGRSSARMLGLLLIAAVVMWAAVLVWIVLSVLL